MLKIDLHIHTVASKHAQGTVYEYIQQAKELGMDAIGIAEHGPALQWNNADEWYFITLCRIPEYVNGVRILKGVEANVLDGKGNIDATDRMLKELDYIIVGFHEKTGYKDLGKKKNTEAMVRAIKSGKVDIVSHPFRTNIYDHDVKKVYEEACRHKVLLEINLDWIKEHKIRHDTLQNLKDLVKTVKKHKQKVIVNSDSHNVWELGDDSSLKKIKKKIGLTDNLIINNYPKELFKLLNVKI